MNKLRDCYNHLQQILGDGIEPYESVELIGALYMIIIFALAWHHIQYSWHLTAPGIKLSQYGSNNCSIVGLQAFSMLSESP